MTRYHGNPEQTLDRDVPNINPVRVAAPIADIEQRSATGPVEINYTRLDAIDFDTQRAEGKARACSLRPPGRSNPSPTVCDPHHVTTEIRAAAADHFERRARALIANGTAEDTAIAQAAEEAVQFTHRTVQLARQCRALIELVDAYQGSTYRLLRDLGNHLNASLAYVDRDTVEAHLERELSHVEWAATNDQFTALDFDDHVGDHGRFRIDWIENLLARAGVPGYGYDAHGEDAVSSGADQPQPEPWRRGTSDGYDLCGQIQPKTRR